MENENSLHCKVSFRNELRRFPMNGVGFTELQKIIQTVFAIERNFPSNIATMKTTLLFFPVMKNWHVRFPV